jgi:phospholipid N-methyltransferase
MMTPEAADDILFIAIDYQGRRYMGAMLLDSSALCRQIYLLLQSHIGLSIEEIGALDLP